MIVLQYISSEAAGDDSVDDMGRVTAESVTSLSTAL